MYAFLMHRRSILNALAMACHDVPASLKSLISKSSARLSFLIPRPLFSLSLALSVGVPIKRCSGLVHGGLSHLWQTYMPRGTSPKWSIHETRLAGAFSWLPPKRIMPYPNGCLAPTHSQQPSFLTTLAQKRSDSGLVIVKV